MLGDPGVQSISIAASYGYELVSPSAADSEGVITYLLAKLHPVVTFSPTTATDLAAALLTWREANRPSDQGGEWVISVSFYAPAAGGTSTGRPLMRVERLLYSLMP